ncbi:MAG: HD domain-containing protein [Bacteroidales bacterium]|nr:HD domain-containing protein [Bacteroidales bacterium]
MTAKRKIINDPVYDGFLSIDDEVILSVIEHPYFQRQRRIKQLGLSHLVYPGAMHTRFSHMLGALNLMRRALDTLRQKGVEITDEECRGAMLAILLHDIGHGPFSHTSERVLVDVHHETLTELFMERMNSEGRLDKAIAIFKNEYHKHFLHQLVSSQLDMDRLDYLSRDSFFTGVSEGIVGTDRIISMLNVKDDELVIDEKGIYSVEKFIISRRLMYWQVYMHKTVIAADQLLLNILRLVRKIQEPCGNAALQVFLERFYSEADFRSNPELLDIFAQVDDDDIMVAIKHWSHSSNKTLCKLCTDLLNRHLPAIKIDNSQEKIASLYAEVNDAAQRFYSGSGLDYHCLVNTGKLRNHAYDFNDPEIKVLYKDGRCVDISEASDQLDRPFLEKTVTKYFVSFPKECKM